MHGYILIVGVALVGILARVFLLETLHQENKVVVVEITSASSDTAVGNIYTEGNHNVTKTDV